MLEDLGNIGDFLGGIGVVVTLAYLAAQIRKNTQSVRSAALDSISTSVAEFIDRIAQDPALAKLWFDGLSASAGMSDTDSQRFNLLLLSLARRWENAYYQSRAGTLESVSWSGMRQGFTSVFLAPGAHAWWQRTREIFDAEFVAFVEQAFSEQSS